MCIRDRVGFTQRYLAERGITATVEFSWGATEAKVVEGLVAVSYTHLTLPTSDLV